MSVPCNALNQAQRVWCQGLLIWGFGAQRHNVQQWCGQERGRARCSLSGGLKQEGGLLSSNGSGASS